LGENQDHNPLKMPNLALKTCIKALGMVLQDHLKAPEMPFLPNFKPYKGLEKNFQMPP
jgi:hypothetical protein